MTHPPGSEELGALAGVVVVDLSRMLPGAILARTLLDLGARVVKVEDPSGGDPLRHAPPFVDGTGAGFAVLLRGACSVTVDLRSEAGRAALRHLLAGADVLVESFRPGTLARWGLSPAELRATWPRLVVVSLAGFAASSPDAALPVHDLNLVGLTGALDLLGPGAAIQLADVSTALLAAVAIPAALLRRERTGRGAHIEQPLVTGPLPFTAWASCERAAGGESLAEALLTGDAPCYRRYRCGDGREVTVAAIEPKYWLQLLGVLGLPELAADGFDTGAGGRSAAEKIAAVFATAPRERWLATARQEALPIAAVHDLAETVHDPPPAELANVTERISFSDGRRASVPAPFIPSLAVGRRGAHAPALGEHDRELLGPSGPPPTAPRR